jgi:hypothetical protein
MGNATIWWYPVGSSTVQEIDLGATFSDLTFSAVREGSDSRSPSRMTRYDRGGYRRVRISKERIANNDALIRDLEALVRHLQAGGTCCATLDKAKAWGTWTTGTVFAGGTSVTVNPPSNAFSTLNSSAALVSGDEVSIESPNPEYLLDLNTYSSLSGSTLTVGEAIRTGFRLGPCFVRYRYFFPALRLPAGQMSSDSLLTHDRLLNWTLVLPLEEHPGDIYNLRLGSQLLAGSDAVGAGSRLDDLLEVENEEPPAIRADFRIMF